MGTGLGDFMEYKFNYLCTLEAATRVISDEYEANRLEDLGRVRELQQSITAINPNVSNILLMAMVNALF
jgi:hypothetical protein